MFSALWHAVTTGRCSVAKGKVMIRFLRGVVAKKGINVDLSSALCCAVGGAAQRGDVLKELMDAVHEAPLTKADLLLLEQSSSHSPSSCFSFPFSSSSSSSSSHWLTALLNSSSSNSGGGWEGEDAQSEAIKAFDWPVGILQIRRRPAAPSAVLLHSPSPAALPPPCPPSLLPASPLSGAPLSPLSPLLDDALAAAEGEPFVASTLFGLEEEQIPASAKPHSESGLLPQQHQQQEQHEQKQQQQQHLSKQQVKDLLRQTREVTLNREFARLLECPYEELVAKLDAEGPKALKEFIPPDFKKSFHEQMWQVFLGLKTDFKQIVVIRTRTGETRLCNVHIR